MLACCPKRLALVDDKGDGPEENALAYPVSHIKGTTSIVVVPARNAGEATLLHHQNPICSQTKATWSHIDLSLGIFCLIPVDS